MASQSYLTMGGVIHRPRFTQSRLFASALIMMIPVLWWTRPKYVTRSMELFLDFLKSSDVERLVSYLHDFLRYIGAPPPYPGANEVALVVTAMTWSFVFYWLVFGKTHVEDRLDLQERLALARKEVAELTHRLEMDDREASSSKRKNGKHKVRIFMEGAFDLMHYGHMNAFRLGHALGTELVVGVNSDESIKVCKGCAPCMSDEERQTAVAACRFVKEVVPNVPYVMTQEYLNEIMTKYDIDYVVHGDDPVIVDGKDVYAHVKAMGKYKSIPRTEGVSTTDIVGRMLLCSTNHHHGRDRTGSDLSVSSLSRTSSVGDDTSIASQKPSSTFYTTSSLLQQFSLNARPRKDGERVVYIDGAWDMFHAGHGMILKKARTFGDYVIVGVHGDDVVNRNMGRNFPIMNLNERVLSVLGCKFVDDVLIDAPWIVTEEMIHSLNIKAVVHGTHNADEEEEDEQDIRYAAPKQRKMFHVVPSPTSLSVEEILGRINENRQRYLEKYRKKKKKEDKYYEGRYGKGGKSKASRDGLRQRRTAKGGQ